MCTSDNHVPIAIKKTLNGESLSRYKSKLSVINCKECPYKLPASVWE